MAGSRRSEKTEDRNKDRTVRDAAAGLQARVLACLVLKRVLHDRQPLDDGFAAISAKAEFAAIPARDRAFARAIATISLRRLGQIEDLVTYFLERPLPAEAFPARLILVCAVAQLVFLGVAPHAAISLAVEQAKGSPGARRFANLINAVLRRVAGEAPAILDGQDAPRLNTPAWLHERWVRAYGAETASKIANAHMEEPPLDLSAKSDPKAWAERLSGTLLPWNSLRLLHKGRIEDIPGYEEGEWWVQDCAAAIPTLLLGRVEGLRVADLCAAPGGKTAQLAARGAHVTAVDISAKRLARLRENLGRLRLEAEIIQANAAEWVPPVPFDAVLLDAPCSATGTIRRNPDIPYLKCEADIAALSKVQERLLDHAMTIVRPGGKIVYCTCSLEPEEGERQITRFLAQRDDVALDAIDPAETHLPTELVSSEGMLRTLPFHVQLGPGLNGMDGFFAARLGKK